MGATVLRDGNAVSQFFRCSWVVQPCLRHRIDGMKPCASSWSPIGGLSDVGDDGSEGLDVVGAACGDVKAVLAPADLVLLPGTERVEDGHRGAAAIGVSQCRRRHRLIVR